MLATNPLKRPRDGREVLAALGGWAEPSGGSRAPVPRPAGARTSRATSGRRRPAAVPGHRMRARAASIAVLPFADMSPARDQEYLSDGIAEEILNALAHVEGLRVTGRTSSFSFKGRNEDLRDIGQKLGVKAILEGSVRKVGNRARIAAHLVGVADGYRMWSGTFDRDLTDVLAVQDEIARAVVDALKVEIGPGPVRKAEHRIRSREAYTQFLLGQQRVNQGTAEGIRAAVEAYERALALDPRFAPAWAGLAVALIWRADYADTAARVVEDQRRAGECAERAVALGGAGAEGHAARGYVRTFCSWDWIGARSDLELALAIAPSKARCLYAFAELQAATGNLPAAIAAGLGAVDLDPLAAQYWACLGRLHEATGELDLARAAMEHALRVSPGHAFAACNLAITELLAGQPEAARAASARCAGKPYGLLPRRWSTRRSATGRRRAARSGTSSRVRAPLRVPDRAGVRVARPARRRLRMAGPRPRAARPWPASRGVRPAHPAHRRRPAARRPAAADEAVVAVGAAIDVPGLRCSPSNNVCRAGMAAALRNNLSFAASSPLAVGDQAPRGGRRPSPQRPMTATTASPRHPSLPINPAFHARWSPRAFTGEEIPETVLMSVFEAARWAPSAMNAQPWRFVYARGGTPEFERFLQVLAPANQAWASHASALVAVVSSDDARPPGNDRAGRIGVHSFDAGAAWAQLALQAHLWGWSTHAMGGFDRRGRTRRWPSRRPPTRDLRRRRTTAATRRRCRSGLARGRLPNDRKPLAELVREGTFGF